MATKKTETQTENETPVVTLETMKAQRKALSEQIKAAEAERKASKQNTLADEIARQEATPNKALVRTIQAAVRLRVQHGATLDDAVTGFLAMCERIARAALDKPAEPEGEDESAYQPEDRKLLRNM